LKLRGSACVMISQSGQSPDLITSGQMAHDNGALTIALTNNPASPLAKLADHMLNLSAGAELSVAATKSFINSTIAGVWLFAELAQDDDLLKAIQSLPRQLAVAIGLDWSAAAVAMQNKSSVLALGRGPSFAMAQEAALKLKETCRLHAEAFSTAEVLHGPVAIVGQDFPIITFASADASEASVVAVCDRLTADGASVFVTSDKVASAHALPCVRTDNPLTDSISLITSH